MIRILIFTALLFSMASAANAQQYNNRRHYNGGDAIGGFIGGFIGGVVGGAVSPFRQPVYVNPVNPVYVNPYCARRFRSYDPYSASYLGFDGLRHRCP